MYFSCICKTKLLLINPSFMQTSKMINIPTGNRSLGHKSHLPHLISLSIAAILLNQHCTYCEIFQPQNTASPQQPVGQNKLTENHLIFFVGSGKHKKTPYHFACLSQSNLRSGLIDSGLTVSWVSVPLPCWRQFWKPGRWPAAPYSTKCTLVRPEKSIWSPTGINQHQPTEQAEQAEEPSLITRQWNSF